MNLLDPLFRSQAVEKVFSNCATLLASNVQLDQKKLRKK